MARAAVLAAAVALFGVHAHAFITMSTARPSAGAARARGRLAVAPDALDASALKARLFEQTAEFARVQEEFWEASAATEAEAAKAAAAAAQGAARRRFWRRRPKRAANEKVGALLEAESFGALEAGLSADLAARRDAIVATIAALAGVNPTAAPTAGWLGRGGVAPAACALNGTWKLEWTNAADATFRKGRRGSARTSQEIDAAAGTFTNVVDFDGAESKVRGFRVVVAGAALSDTEVQLAFKRVVLLRRSRLPRLFGRVVIPLPSPRLLRALGRVLSRGKADQSSRGAGFELLFLDADTRMHRTFDGLYFVQRRLGDGEH